MPRFTRVQMGYVRQLVKQSWGLTPCPLTCPVCKDVLPIQEWKMYVSRDLAEQYQTLNRPFRPFLRYCSSCASPVEVIPPPLHLDLEGDKGDERKRVTDQVTRDLHHRLSLPIPGKEGDERVTPSHLCDLLQRRIQDLSAHRRKESMKRSAKGSKEECFQALALSSPSKRKRGETAQGTPDSTCDVPLLNQGKREASKLARKALDDCLDLEVRIIQRLSTLETQEVSWRKAQFLRISLYPRSTWLYDHPSHSPMTAWMLAYSVACNTKMCLQCGETTHHRSRTCQQYLEKRAKSRETRVTRLRLRSRFHILFPPSPFLEYVRMIPLNLEETDVGSGNSSASESDHDDMRDAASTQLSRGSSGRLKRSKTKVVEFREQVPEAGVPDVERILTRRISLRLPSLPPNPPEPPETE
ncbi:hypothetical protein BJ684DRAFT_19163 [Piptocephalis cylindrospora]|uniref:Uncharacterized protein n=1 Tax=Piptocephalis cylindrospora TaxID=1907219 RepID=A0A4P9Y629_9FUNG|nr:hypothetical protein BJ684DRAFT_19163 [Piptocephalis cylindrospora]|eukprot:RKP14425.1 hypothetical protein BJ684DRAFT_19163 [Piptocephalis cylindrospora]